MSRLPLSCFIITRNEADRIARTIRAVRDWVEEVIVVDSGSTDATQIIAKSEGARVVFNPWPGFGPQKRFGETLCRNDWILNIDADEVVTPALADEIKALFGNTSPPLSTYAITINDVYPGQSRPRLWARDYLLPRLYDKRVARFSDSPLHDVVVTHELKVGTLRGEIYHFSSRSFDDQMQKALSRGHFNADLAKPKSISILRVRVVSEFPLSFLKYYVLRGHFTGGLAGFQAAMISAVYHFARVVRMLELARGVAARDVETSALARRKAESQ